MSKKYWYQLYPPKISSPPSPDIQTLNSGEQKRYSLIFMVDPKVTKDSKTKYIKEAIIQFTFFSKEEYDKKKG